MAVTRAPRSAAIDRVKASAIVAVVVTHAGPDRWSPHLGAADEWLRYSWTPFHVPAFLLMAGTLARTRAPLPAATLVRRLRRVVLPYLVVLAALYATALAPLPPLAELPIAVALGASYGIYYYVPVFVLCIALGWLLSRWSDVTIVALAIALATYACVAAVMPGLTPTSLFWRMRDPLSQFWFGYFVLGWLAVPQRLAARVPRTALAFAAAALVPLWVHVGFPGPPPLRCAYTLAVVSMLWTLPVTAPGMRFLSDASLGIYLLHRPIQDLLDPFVHGSPPTVRIATLVVGSLAASVACCAAARRVLGREQARRWLGA